MQGIDDGVAGDENPGFGDAFFDQVICRPFGRREVQIGQVAGQDAVYLLWEGRKAVSRRGGNPASTCPMRIRL